MENKYPKENEIKVEWTKTHIAIVIIITLFVFGFLFYESTIKKYFIPNI